jgi:predicted metalloprotease with PDZ domain
MTNRRALALVVGSTLALSPVRAQQPLTTYDDAFEARRGREQPVVRYTVRIDPADRTGYDVEMRLGNAPDTVRLRMPVWAPGAYRLANFARYVRGLGVAADGRPVAVVREDSSTWRAVVGGVRTVAVRYRVTYPSPEAASAPNNRAFLRETGGLVDGPATYLYLAEHKLAPAHVTFALPTDWRIATGLVPTADPRTFFAPSYDVLVDSPVLVGGLRTWTFEAAGAPHRVAYWPLPDAAPFDTAAFVASVRTIVDSAASIFGEVPYRDYTFLYVDGTGGGLEHLNSTTIGAPSAALAKDPRSRTGVSAHEFFHLWNVKRIRPAVLGPFDYQAPVRTTGLWWSEGVTDFFADEIERRAGFTTEAQARSALAGTIQSYLANPAHSRISPERSSWTAWDPPAVNGGYSISYYTQGALIGHLLELHLRDATEMRRGMDDVVRLLYDRYAGPRGFTGEDLLNAVNEVCRCDLQPFFERHVSGATPPDFDHYLGLLGWKLAVEKVPARTETGEAVPDLRVSLLAFAGVGSAGGAAGGRPRLSVPDPTGAWGQAGLQTGDELVTVNGSPVRRSDELGAVLAGAKIGDEVRVEFGRAGALRTAVVRLTPYEATLVRIVELPRVTERQQRMRRRWLLGGR